MNSWEQTDDGWNMDLSGCATLESGMESLAMGDILHTHGKAINDTLPLFFYRYHRFEGVVS